MASSPTYATLPNNTHPSWWRDPGLRQLMFWQSCILLSQMTVGYDESVVGSLQAMKPWIRDMGNPSSNDLGLITSSLFIAAFVGAFFTSPVADRFGRRWSLFTGSFLAVAGAAVQSAAQSKGMFIGGRVLIGLGVAFTTSAGPSLLNEIAHPRMRGRVSSSFNVLWYVGSIVSSWLCFGTGHLTTSWSWRIPSIVQGIPALLQVILILFMPESPRFLCSRGRIAEAKAILVRYHANGAVDDELVAWEMTQIVQALEPDAAHKRTSWMTVLKSKANRKRFAICIAVSLLTLWNGQGVISYYFTPILNSVGITSTNQQTGINGGMQISNLLFSIWGMWLSESMGRKPLWLLSFFGMVCANVPLTIATARQAKTGSKAAAYTVVVFIFLYNAMFNIGCNPLPYSYTTEILPYEIRTKGLAIFIAVSEGALAFNQYVNPIALASIDYWYWVFYLGMLWIGIAIIYFFFPETKGHTLEELALLFEDPKDRGVPVLEGVTVFDGEQAGVGESGKGKQTRLSVEEKSVSL